MVKPVALVAAYPDAVKGRGDGSTSMTQAQRAASRHGTALTCREVEGNEVRADNRDTTLSTDRGREVGGWSEHAVGAADSGD